MKTAEHTIEKKFTNIENSSQPVIGQKVGYDYSKIDKHGLVKEGTEITDETMIIGMTSNIPGKDELIDHSESTKKGQLGIVHKVFITDGEEGTRIAKVKIREERIPAIGDKMASRSGQKGTIGMIVPEPFGTNNSGPRSPTIDGRPTGGSPPSAHPGIPITAAPAGPEPAPNPPNKLIRIFEAAAFI
jgi:hypothetical protein